MRLFKDGRGLLRRVRWVRVVAVTAAIGAVVGWARRDDEEAAAVDSLRTLTTTPSGWRAGETADGAIFYYGSPVVPSNTTLIDSVSGPGKQGYSFEASVDPIPTTFLPIGK